MIRPVPKRRRSIRAAAVSMFSVAALGAGSLVLVGTSPAAAADTLLSQYGTASASSVENGDYTPASAAFDGSSRTRWSSLATDPQWLEVDLGAPASLTKVELDWEAAYASAYRIQTSTDNVTWTTAYSTTTGKGGVESVAVVASARYVRMYGTARATGYGYSLWELKVFGTGAGGGSTPMPAFNPNLDPGESATLPAGSPVIPSTYVPPPGQPTHHEFQANCAVTHEATVDPIVFPKLPGASHDHTFLGNHRVDAFSTTGSLSADTPDCTTPGDHSGYWFPTLYNGDTRILPVGRQVIYYKSGVSDYRSVVPFPKGLRFVVGDPRATEAQFRQSPGAVEGWECGNAAYSWDLPTSCAPGSDLVVRYQAPSCWDGIHLDVPGHKSHMAYPVDGHCTTDHPVAVPMLEFKMAFPVSGNLSGLRLASGRGYTWHYDFFNAWEPDVLYALVKHCIDGGLQCNPRGFDQYKPDRGAALDENYRPLPNP